MTENELFDQLRRRTAMYIGHASPTHLSSFLFGSYFSKMDEEIKE
ncbi:hypothetical protein [Flammeovirga sp. OC4]|nr:hypothetical protein [Flammeovirga sp. OC4]